MQNRTTTNLKKKDVLQRITLLGEAMLKGREYLECGKHADWTPFRPWFQYKVQDGKRLPPHKDWIKHVFLPRCERALKRTEKILEKLESK